jgi:hypothetical protein
LNFGGIINQNNEQIGVSVNVDIAKVKCLLLNGFPLWNQDINGSTNLKVQTTRTAKLVLGSQTTMVEMHLDQFLKHKNQIDSTIVV